MALLPKCLIRSDCWWLIPPQPLQTELAVSTNRRLIQFLHEDEDSRETLLVFSVEWKCKKQEDFSFICTKVIPQYTLTDDQNTLLGISCYSEKIGSSKIGFYHTTACHRNPWTSSQGDNSIQQLTCYPEDTPTQATLLLILLELLLNESPVPILVTSNRPLNFRSNFRIAQNTRRVLNLHWDSYKIINPWKQSH